MKEKRIQVAQWLLAAVLLPAIAGCGASCKSSREAKVEGDAKEEITEAAAPEVKKEETEAPVKTTPEIRKDDRREPVPVVYGPRPTTYTK